MRLKRGGSGRLALQKLQNRRKFLGARLASRALEHVAAKGQRYERAYSLIHAVEGSM